MKTKLQVFHCPASNTPITQLNQWKHEEALRGVAGGASITLLGAVVVAVNPIGIGKQDGPEVLVRFKICKSASTDWVGWIMGGRCIDCPTDGGLGFVPLEHSHSFAALGVQTERSEYPGLPRPDHCYAARLSVLDSDSDGDEPLVGAARASEQEPPRSGPSLEQAARAGVPLLYEGDPITISQGEGAWVPAVTASADGPCSKEGCKCAFLCSGSPVEAVPGLWDQEDGQEVACIIGIDEFNTVLELGTKVAQVHAVVQTRVCQHCGCMDMDAWLEDAEMPKCPDCGAVKVLGPSSCRQCGAAADACCVLSYVGCNTCRSESELKGRVVRGPASGFLA